MSPKHLYVDHLKSIEHGHSRAEIACLLLQSAGMQTERVGSFPRRRQTVTRINVIVARPHRTTAKHNLAVLLGLLCLLAAIWATGVAGEVRQKTFAIYGSNKYLRGMYSMIEAEKFPFGDAFVSQLRKATESKNLTAEYREKMRTACQWILEWQVTHGYLEKRQYEDWKEDCKTKPQVYHTYFLKVMWALIEIADDGHCISKAQWQLFLSTNRPHFTLWDPEGIKKVFRSYMNYFGKEKLAKCRSKAVKFMSKMHENSTPNLDKFFKTLFQLPKADDRELHERLRNANLLVDKLDFASTLKLSNVIWTVRRVTSVRDDYEPNNGKDVMAFISRKCEMLAREFEGMLDVILLSEDSVKKSELDDKVKKWIEYDHACWYLVKYQKKFIRHVDRLLGTPESIFEKGADFLTRHVGPGSG
jgi:hypothetical protein